MVSFTSISRLSGQIQNEKINNMKSCSTLTIDDVLNVIDSPVAVNKTPISCRNLRRNSSLVDNYGSINEETVSSSFDNEQKLKLLESNFNQIAMAHHTDEQSVGTNLEIYRDKYKKANTYMDLLFDEVTNSINKMLNLLINEQLENGNDSSMSCNSMNHKSLSIDSNYDCNISSHCSTNAKSSSVKYKRLMQENLSLLNKTIERVRKNLICLVTTSSTISGLKQVNNSLYSVLLKLNLNDFK